MEGDKRRSNFIALDRLDGRGSGRASPGGAERSGGSPGVFGPGVERRGRTRYFLARMAFFGRFFGRRRGAVLKPQRLDYLNEALALERQGDYDAALTSYRLALRDHPSDPRVLQNMAIALTKTNRYDEAIRHYRKALDVDGNLAGAHYGLAFLLLSRGDTEAAAEHLQVFLRRPPRGPDADKWIEHARVALTNMGYGETS